MNSTRRLCDRCTGCYQAVTVVWMVFLLASTGIAETRRGITRISVNAKGVEGNGPSGVLPSRIGISANGHQVFFRTGAGNLDPLDNSERPEVYVRDTRFNITRALTTNGAVFQDVSPDGSKLVFSARLPDTDVLQIFLRDLATGAITLISQSDSGEFGNGDSRAARVSDDGRVVVFESEASNLSLVSSSASANVFMRNASQQTLRRIDLTGLPAVEPSDRTITPSLSADGSIVSVFSDGITDHGAIVAINQLDGSTQQDDVSPTGTSGNDTSFSPTLSPDGSAVAFLSIATNLAQGASNGSIDVLIRDRNTGDIQRANVASSGNQSDNDSLKIGGFSGNGRYLVYSSVARDLVDLDRNGDNRITKGEDIFVFDRITRRNTRVNLTFDHREANDYCSTPVISRDGAYVAFVSPATNLVPNDTNQEVDVFRVPFRPVFTPDFLLDRAPGIRTVGDRVEVAMQEFSRIARGTRLRVEKAMLAALTAPGDRRFRLVYEIIARDLSKSSNGPSIRRWKSRKPTVRIQQFSQGRYAVQYRVRVTRKGRWIANTKVSPARVVKVGE